MKLSLRWRITLLTGMIILLAAVSLTVLSMYNANNTFSMITDHYQINTVQEPSITTTNVALSSMSATAKTDSAPKSSVNIIAEAKDAKDANAITVTIKRQFNITSLIYLAVVSLCSMILIYWAAGKALKPVHTLNQAVLTITANNLHQRLAENDSTDEISSLTKSFNIMLNRLHEAFLKQKCFSSSAAHELKTPLAIIKTNLQVLELAPEATISDYQAAFTITKRTVDRLTAVVDDLLMLVTDGSDELEMEIISLNALLYAIVHELTVVYNAKNIIVSYDFNKAETFVLCNNNLAYRFFYNLIENSMKYNRQNGKIVLSIKEDSQTITVVVADSGIGIPAEALSAIWDAFYCVDPSRSRRLGGAGLGLSIVKIIAEQFGWIITVESQPDVGTRFTTTIPKTTDTLYDID